MPDHTLIWKYSKDRSRPCGGDALRQWQLLVSYGGVFRRLDAGEIGKLAESVVTGAIGRNVDITIGAWGSIDPASTTPDQLEELFGDLQSVLVCPARSLSPERREIDSWVICDHQGTPTILPTGAMQSALSHLVAQYYPSWKARESYGSLRATDDWTAKCLMVRPGLSGEQLNLIEPEPLMGDRLLNEILADPEVRPAYVAEDASLPETTAALARALLAAHERRGVPPDQRVFMRSGQAEDILNPVLLNMEGDLTFIDRSEGAGGRRIPVLAHLREKLSRFAELRDFVLVTMLRDYGHHVDGLDRLREAAGVTAA